METWRTGWLRSRRFRRSFLALAVLAALGAWMFRPHAVTIHAAIGRPVADFTLPDTLGHPVSLHGYQGKKAVVLAFMGTECPVGNLYMARLVELSQAYRDRGVAFLIVNANAHETADQVAEHARSFRVEFPVLKDPENRLADQLGVERTCATLVLDGHGRLRYRGAIDDQYDRGRRKTAATRNYLVEALDAVLAGRTVAVATTPVIGCPIDRAGAIALVGNRPRVPSAPPTIRAAFASTRRARCGRPGDLHRGCCSDLAGQVPVVPPTGPGWPVLAPDLRARRASAGRASRSARCGRGAAAGGCHPGTPTRQRTVPSATIAA